ncbi:MAG: alpha-mannosidase 2c1, partial [Planctomycetes bacterium]|nr:alpha-mannosidase 2c1 [Planctomycetota bacterium]
MRNEQLTHFVAKAERFLWRLKDGAPLTATAPLTAEFARSVEPVPFAERLALAYQPIAVGDSWGKAWESAWFHLRGKVPAEWAGKRVVAHLNFNGEACVFGLDGCPLYGLTNGSVFAENYSKDVYRLFDRCAGGEAVDLWVEAAANNLFGVNLKGDPRRDDPDRFGTYDGKVVSMELAAFDDEVWGLMLDVEVLLSLFRAVRVGAGARGGEQSWGSLKTIPEATPRAKRILRALHAAIVAYADDPANAAAARAALKPVLRGPANASDLKVTAVGHAHIDTGWMWPVRESVRKVARTFSSQVALMEKYPGYVFGASQPQLYAFARDRYPALYTKIKEWVKRGNWELQGGMWVEADCNVTGGEAMVRQFVHGKNFYMDEFGQDVRNLWLPDVFGYSANLPQIMRGCGVDYFLTQKISWSQFNQFPFNTFRWRGIDGSEVLTHFPPEDTYNSFMMPEDQVKAQNNFKENDLLDDMMCLFGIGDGGGGPKEEYVERALRMGDLEGCPKVAFGRADAFFEKIAPHSQELELWDGELYLELHRGTLTTQARVKRGNRLLENALRAAEFVRAGLPDYPLARFDALWKTLLINQFHDILPGSSIRMVYETTEREHAASLVACREIIAEAAAKLGGEADCVTFVNTLTYPFTAPVALPAGWENCAVVDAAGAAVPAQTDAGGAVARVVIPACGT